MESDSKRQHSFCPGTSIRILYLLGSGKKSTSQPPLNKANIFMCQNWAKKYMKIDFPKVIFKDRSQLIFDGRRKGWILSNSVVAKRRQ